MPETGKFQRPCRTAINVRYLHMQRLFFRELRWDRASSRAEMIESRVDAMGVLSDRETSYRHHPPRAVEHRSRNMRS